MHTASLIDDMVLWRRDFDAHPELGFNVLRRGKGNGSIGIRADMDALPITEANDLPHRSQSIGVMHACGRDGHTAMVLGAAARHPARNGGINGRVVFVFQPNKRHGLDAPAMIADGLFETFDVDSIYAIHNMPDLPLAGLPRDPAR